MNSACEHPIRITCSHSDFPVFGLRPKLFFSGPRLAPCLSPSPEKTVARCFRAPESRRRFRVSRQSLVPRWRFHADSRVLCLTGVSLHVPGDLSRRPRPRQETTRPSKAPQALRAPLKPAAMRSRAPTSPDGITTGSRIPLTSRLPSRRTGKGGQSTYCVPPRAARASPGGDVRPGD